MTTNITDMKRILLVDDEENIRNTLLLSLELEGYDVRSMGDGLKLIDRLQQEHFDLLILDVMLPHTNGLELCQQVRLRYPTLPILFLSAKADGQDVINGLKIGGDDYMTKPFHLEELLLRIDKLMVRHHAQPKQVHTLDFGANHVNFVTHEVRTALGTPHLSEREMRLLKLLAEHENEVLTRQSILQQVWGYDIFPTTRTIDNYIASLRKHFEADPKQPKYFHSIRGVGYKFTRKQED